MNEKNQGLIRISSISQLTKAHYDLQGEASCLLVYSDKSHVDYIYPLLSQLESVLERKGFNPKRLGDEIRSSEDYFERLDKMVNDCSLGVIVLDGFRPNVLFEFGYLKGKRKPIILLQSKDSTVNIKTLYREASETGLTETQFLRLRNPKLDVAFQLSDFAGKHIATIDWKAKGEDPLHPTQILLGEITKIDQDIIKETLQLKIKGFSKRQETDLLEPVIDVISLYFADKITVSVKHIQRLHSKIRQISRNERLKQPIQILNMIMAIYEKKLKDAGPSETVSCLRHIQGINDDILSTVSAGENENFFAMAQMRKGTIFFRLFTYSYEREHWTGAIDAYEKALEVYERKQMDYEYAKAQRMIGSVYVTLSQIENAPINLERAIEAYKNAIEKLTYGKLPLEYVNAHYDLGIAYFNLAQSNGGINDYKKANAEFESLLKLGKFYLLIYGLYVGIIAANAATTVNIARLENNNKLFHEALIKYDEVLTYVSEKKDPISYAAIQNNIGTDYGELARLENKSENCKKAIHALNESLKIYTYEELPLDYALANINLCEVYRILATAEDTTTNYQKAIEAGEKALRERICKISPLHCVKALYNLAAVYRTLADSEEPKENNKKAIEAYIRILSVGKGKLSAKEFAETKRKLADTYDQLTRISLEEIDYEKAVLEYEEAMTAYEEIGDLDTCKVITKAFKDMSQFFKGRNPQA